MKFGGMSTPWGIFFYGENYQSQIINGKLKISKNTTSGKHIIYPMMAIYLLFDILINFKEFIITHISKYSIPQPVYINFNFSIPDWIKVAIVSVIIILEYGFLVWFMYKVRGYHGAEHKVILAAKNGNIFNARYESRITSHCGSNLLFPYLSFFAMFWAIGYTLPGTAMILSFVVYMKVLKLRRFLSYVGSYVQRATTSEPSEKQLKEAQRGIKTIINAEETRIFRRIRPFFNNISSRT